MPKASLVDDLCLWEGVVSNSPLGKKVKIKSKFDGRILTGMCKDEVDCLIGTPVVITDDGPKDIGYYWDLIEILD